MTALERDEMMTEWAEQAKETTISAGKGRPRFRNFLHQPAIREALVRYVHAETRFFLWRGINERHGVRDELGELQGPAWLDKSMENDWDEAERAEMALEVAIQEEVARRVEAAQTEAKTRTKKTTGPRLRELTRHLAAVVRRGVGEEQQAGFAETDQSLTTAGLTSTPPRKPLVPKP